MKTSKICSNPHTTMFIFITYLLIRWAAEFELDPTVLHNRHGDDQNIAEERYCIICFSSIRSKPHVIQLDNRVYNFTSYFLQLFHWFYLSISICGVLPETSIIFVALVLPFSMLAKAIVFELAGRTILWTAATLTIELRPAAFTLMWIFKLCSPT